MPRLPDSKRLCSVTLTAQVFELLLDLIENRLATFEGNGREELAIRHRLQTARDVIIDEVRL